MPKSGGGWWYSSVFIRDTRTLLPPRDKPAWEGEGRRVRVRCCRDHTGSAATENCNVAEAEVRWCSHSLHLRLGSRETRNSGGDSCGERGRGLGVIYLPLLNCRDASSLLESAEAWLLTLVWLAFHYWSQVLGVLPVPSQSLPPHHLSPSPFSHPLCVFSILHRCCFV